MNVGKKPAIKRFSTDTVMIDLWSKMVRDFRCTAGPMYCRDQELALLESIPTFRNYVWPDRLNASPLIFKREAQLENFFKRYRFENDLYSDEELHCKTIEKFDKLQQALGSQWDPNVSESVFRTLQLARTIIRKILSGVDLAEASSLGRFSTRATVGCPAGDAYLDHKFAGFLTGSHEHVDWLRSQLPHDTTLWDALDECSPPGGPIWAACDSLPLIGVPKSFKSERLISPNTLVGSYYTYGLGKLIVKALKGAGLKVSKLQVRHRELARLFSINRAYVTADLSAASESFTYSLINRLLPRKWVNALNFGRLRYYNADGKKYFYSSFMAMGIGFTFPLQTLLFYGLVEAVRTLSKVDGYTSVYGDDLIYPRVIHTRVKHIFTKIGFTLNEDKTFVESNFRESCGGDYFHGVDVRPFQPEGASSQLTRTRYEAFLYKLYNGLQLRWNEYALPGTYHFLRREILRCRDTIFQVPPKFPETSGIRVKFPESFSMEGLEPVSVSFHDGSRWFSFRHLGELIPNRYVDFQSAYLWDALRSLDQGDLVKTAEEEREDGSTWSMYDSVPERMSWIKAKKQPRNYRGKNRKRLKKLVAVTACKLTPGKVQVRLTDSLSDWI